MKNLYRKFDMRESFSDHKKFKGVFGADFSIWKEIENPIDTIVNSIHKNSTTSASGKNWHTINIGSKNIDTYISVLKNHRFWHS